MDTTIEYLLYPNIVEVGKFWKNSRKMKIMKKQNYRYYKTHNLLSTVLRELPYGVVILIGPESVSGHPLTT